MVIEFNGLPPSKPPKAGADAPVKTGREDAKAQQGESEGPAAADKISLTDAVSRLQKLEQRLADLPVVDSQRVEALKKIIAEGSYNVGYDLLERIDTKGNSSSSGGCWRC